MKPGGLWTQRKLIGRFLPAYALLTLASVMGDLIITLGLAGLLKVLFDAVAVSDSSLLLKALIGMAALTAWMATLYPAISYWNRVLHKDISGEVRKRIFAHIQSLPIAHLKEGHSGEFTSRLTSDIAVCEEGYAGALPELFGGILVALVSLGWMVVLDWKNTAFALTVTVLCTGVSVYYGKIIRDLSSGVQDSLAKVMTRLTDILHGLQVIKVFDLKDLILRKFSRENERVVSLSLRRAGKNAALTALNNLLGNLTLVGILCVGAYRYVRGSVTLGTAIAVVHLLNPVSNLLQRAGELTGQLSASLAAAARLDEIMQIPLEPERWRVPGPIGQMTDPPLPGIEMKDVTFSYLPGQPVLQRLSLRVEHGQVVALVGPSGGGKSTVFRLLAGFYPPESGSIIIGGVPLEEQTLAELRGKLALVPQDTYLFAGSVAENIGYGRPGASREEIIAAAKAANAHDFITGMQDGYDTQVGERGSHLSGGERQRIAIARAILKDAPVLLLDEATSALDATSEELVQDALERLMQGKTTLVIAHRLSTVQRADKIAVVRDGTVVEEGTHSDLLARQDGAYRKLYFEQFAAVDSGRYYRE